jgi:hypothetical protein
MTVRRRLKSAISPFCRFLAAGCAALVILLTVLAVCPELHAWLHGEKQLDADDDCAVVLFANGVTPAAAAVAVVVIFLCVWRERATEAATLLLQEPRFQRPPACGPPVAA